ncbi:phosphoadenosine phosphosulfate reductase [Labrenzia polysiphoniae]|uniref:Phosphoadenosine phosphosulfate reductase n=1 Tax=Roseibium polysiphoniae TaxID=2571221 RepID=A0ABR9C8W8_9HYPH|nr:phosphoadenosine phosphosulfate reductase [Roseibium polysiphoniae]
MATKLAIASGIKPKIFYCEVKEEHPDNIRFLRDCENWFGVDIEIIGKDEYSRSADVVFRNTKFLVGPSGARCTAELKKSLRWKYGKPDDILIMGYTLDEAKRIERLLDAEPILRILPILIEKKLTKRDCLNMVERAGIKLPKMYELGYRNNNCIGCVKGQAGYWNKIRIDFPERFKEMAKIERELNRKICKIEWRTNGSRHLRRVFLDELPDDVGSYKSEPESECGIFCQAAEAEI